jgi:hypothetical protein
MSPGRAVFLVAFHFRVGPVVGLWQVPTSSTASLTLLVKWLVIIRSIACPRVGARGALAGTRTSRGRSQAMSGAVSDNRPAPARGPAVGEAPTAFPRHEGLEHVGDVHKPRLSASGITDMGNVQISTTISATVA